MDDAIYDEDVNYDALEQHTYEDSGDAVFYTCPLCLCVIKGNVQFFAHFDSRIASR